MAVTMVQIDHARDAVHRALDVQRAKTTGEAGVFEVALVGMTAPGIALVLEERRARVDRLLREWWAQGCKEVA